MSTSEIVLIVVLGLVILMAATATVCLRRSGQRLAEASAEMRATGLDLVRLPGRLRRLAADPRTPRRARWALIGLAVYVASPIDPIPHVLPLIGQLDEAILVPIGLIRIRRMIPPDVWAEHFPSRAGSG